MIARLARVDSGRMELRTPETVLALARRAHGTDTWALTRAGDRAVWRAEGETAARLWLSSIADQEETE